MVCQEEFSQSQSHLILKLFKVMYMGLGLTSLLIVSTQILHLQLANSCLFRDGRYFTFCDARYFTFVTDAVVMVKTLPI